MFLFQGRAGSLGRDFGVDCARFDGDIDPKVRNQELDRFRTSLTCRVLLMTVQSGGTGLNIVEANNVCFLDRWFNPQVHAQMQDRCHRIGQKRQVNVFFADVAATVDQAMAYLNTIKSVNATIILADGTELASRPEGALTYRELAGLFGNVIRALKTLRQASAKVEYNAPLLPVDYDVLAEAAARKATRTKSELSEAPAEEPASCSLGEVAPPSPPVSAVSSRSEEMEVAPVARRQ